MVDAIQILAVDWRYDAISLGYPGLIEGGKPVREPLNLGGGWLAFDYRKELKRPIRMINDACLQALANYEGGRMLFLGFGTSIGAAFVTHDVLVPLELGLLRLTRRGRSHGPAQQEFLKREGRKRWRRQVSEAIPMLQGCLPPDRHVLGGGNAKFIDPVPPARLPGEFHSRCVPRGRKALARIRHAGGAARLHVAHPRQRAEPSREAKAAMTSRAARLPLSKAACTVPLAAFGIRGFTRKKQGVFHWLGENPRGLHAADSLVAIRSARKGIFIPIVEEKILQEPSQFFAREAENQRQRFQRALQERFAG